jgi:hypothetical protein
MTTATATAKVRNMLITVEVQADHVSSLQEDAERAVQAAAAALAAMSLPCSISTMRAEFERVDNGNILPNLVSVRYDEIMCALTSAADCAATEDWHNPDGACVTVDVIED